MRIPPADYQRLVDENEELHRQLAEAEPTDWLEAVMTKRILVHTKDGISIEGSLVAQMDDGIVLRAAKLIDAPDRTTALLGEVWIPSSNLAFAQLES